MAYEYTKMYYVVTKPVHYTVLYIYFMFSVLALRPCGCRFRKPQTWATGLRLCCSCSVLRLHRLHWIHSLCLLCTLCTLRLLLGLLRSLIRLVILITTVRIAKTTWNRYAKCSIKYNVYCKNNLLFFVLKPDTRSYYKYR